MSQELRCKYFDRGSCGSCSLLALPQEVRNADKVEKFENQVIKHFGAEVVIKEIFAPETYFPSRVRAKLSVSGTVETPVIGLLDKDFNGVELCDCPLHFPEINELLNKLPRIITDFKLTPYDVRKRSGELKGVIVRAAADRRSLALRFVLRSTESIPRIKKALDVLKSTTPLLKVVSANIQPVPHQIVEGEEEIVLTGESIIWERFDDLELAFHPRSFAQATPEVAKELYKYVAAQLNKYGASSVLDLYCGVGGFSLTCARSIGRGLGLEISKEAIDCAALSAKKNGFVGFDYLVLDVDRDLKSQVKGKFDALVVNPPRRGISDSVLEYIKDSMPGLIAYSSCNYETMFRDIQALADLYQVQEFKPFDMFVLTSHLEVVCILKRVQKDK